MTPRQRESLVSVQREIAAASRALARLERRAHQFSDLFETSATDEEAFTPEEVERLVRLNERLAKLEYDLYELDQRLCTQMSARVADPEDPLDDFEIDVTLHFMLRGDDPDYDDDSDNFLTERRFGLKGNDKDPRLDGDFRETIRRFPGRLDEIPHCWLFHDLYDHSYGLAQPALSLHDCLRIERIWVHVVVDHQATLDLETGDWLPANRFD